MCLLSDHLLVLILNKCPPETAVALRHSSHSFFSVSSSDGFATSAHLQPTARSTRSLEILLRACTRTYVWKRLVSQGMLQVGRDSVDPQFVQVALRNGCHHLLHFLHAFPRLAPIFPDDGLRLAARSGCMETVLQVMTDNYPYILDTGAVQGALESGIEDVVQLILDQSSAGNATGPGVLQSACATQGDPLAMLELLRKRALRMFSRHFELQDAKRAVTIVITDKSCGSTRDRWVQFRSNIMKRRKNTSAATDLSSASACITRALLSLPLASPNAALIGHAAACSLGLQQNDHFSIDPAHFDVCIQTQCDCRNSAAQSSVSPKTCPISLHHIEAIKEQASPFDRVRWECLVRHQHSLLLHQDFLFNSLSQMVHADENELMRYVLTHARLSPDDTAVVPCARLSDLVDSWPAIFELEGNERKLRPGFTVSLEHAIKLLELTVNHTPCSPCHYAQFKLLLDTLPGLVCKPLPTRRRLSGWLYMPRMWPEELERLDSKLQFAERLLNKSFGCPSYRSHLVGQPCYEHHIDEYDNVALICLLHFVQSPFARDQCASFVRETHVQLNNLYLTAKLSLEHRRALAFAVTALQNSDPTFCLPGGRATFPPGNSDVARRLLTEMQVNSRQKGNPWETRGTRQ